MNEFFVSDFNISKIIFCMTVGGKSTKFIHRNRLNHGIVYEINGVKRYEFKNGKSFTVKAGDIFYLPKFSDYDVVVIKSGECIAVNFELSEQNQTFEQFVITPDKSNQLYNDFKEIVKLWQKRKQGNLNRCFAILYNIIYQLQQIKTTDYVSSKNKTIAISASEYIALHLGDSTLTIEQLAKKYDITPEYFRKIFKTTYNISPRKYIINLRINFAKELLLSREFNIDYISLACGFDSVSYFSRTFKSVVGVNPSDYAKMQ